MSNNFQCKKELTKIFFDIPSEDSVLSLRDRFFPKFFFERKDEYNETFETADNIGLVKLGPTVLVPENK